MILLVVGLVAVIVVVLIAVFLSIRLGRGAEDDEADLRSSGRERRRDQDERWEDPDTRRVPVSGSRGGRGDYPGYGNRGPAPGRAARGPLLVRGSWSPGNRRAPLGYRTRTPVGYRGPASARPGRAAGRGRWTSDPARHPRHGARAECSERQQ